MNRQNHTDDTNRDPWYRAEKRGDPRYQAFRSWVQHGDHVLTGEQRKLLTSNETRALSASTGNLGGDTVPTGFVYELEIALKWYGGILQACKYIDTDMGNTMPWPTFNDTGNTAEITAENSAVSGATGGAAEMDPAYGAVTFGAYMIDSGIVKIPVQLFDDSAFNLESYLGDAMATRIGRKLNTMCTVGTGSAQPTGIVTAATLGATSTTAAGITYNDLLNILHSVDPAYRNPRTGNPGWMFCDSTLKLIRQLVDGNGRPLWLAGGTTQGIDQAQPDTLLGFPVYLNQDMPAIAPNSKSVIFGDLSRYKVRRVKQVIFRRLNERFIDSLQIGVLAWLRADGNLTDAGSHPVKYMAQAAS